MSALPIRDLRLRNQRLAGRPFARADEAVRWLGAVQAQDYYGAQWALAQRSRTASDAAIDKLLADGAIIRTHILRPTWHFVAPEDIRWMMALSGPRVHQGNAGRYRDLGLDAETLKRGNDVLARALEGGAQLTRAEAAEAFRRAGIPTDGQRLVYLLMHAELDAVICSGAIRGKQHTYALLDDRVPPAAALSRDEALAGLVRRYFVGHGPALPQDFSWWSGLTLGDARRGIEANGPALRKREFDARVYRSGGHDAKAGGGGTAYLLPNYDEYFIAYRHRGDYFDPARFARKPPATAFNRHIVVLDGFIAGGWDRRLGGSGVTVDIALYADIGAAEHDSIAAAAERYANFLGRKLTLRFA